jgi:hypothetical protein
MRQVVAVAGSSALLVLILHVIAAGGESAVDHGNVRLFDASVTGNEQCDAFARFWTEVAGADMATIADLSGCRQDARGTWLLARGTNLPRLAGNPNLGATDGTATIDRRREIEGWVAAFVASLPRSQRRSLEAVYDPVARPGMGHLREGRYRRSVHARYLVSLTRYLDDPRNAGLAAYVAWHERRAAAATTALRHGCRSRPRMTETCERLIIVLARANAPWPWELRDDLKLTAYLASTPEPAEPVPSAPEATTSRPGGWTPSHPAFAAVRPNVGAETAGTSRITPSPRKPAKTPVPTATVSTSGR